MQQHLALPGFIVLASAMVAACRSEAPPAGGNALAPGNVATGPVESRRLEPPQPLTRRDLLFAAHQARSDSALGIDDREAQSALDNRRFELRIRIGCTISPPGSDIDRPQATYEPDRRRLTLTVTPDISLDDPVVGQVVGEGPEAVEGFWLDRPWLLESSCVATPASQPEFGLVQLFTTEDPRTERREGRAYETHVTLPENSAAPQAGGWDLVLRGRLRKRPDGRSIVCRSVTAGALPLCLILVEFERVAVENVRSGEQLATWGRG